MKLYGIFFIYNVTSTKYLCSYKNFNRKYRTVKTIYKCYTKIYFIFHSKIE